MKKYIILSLKILLLFIGFYLGYKCYYLYKYQISSNTIKNYEEYINLITNYKTLTINSENEENVDYLELNNIKIKNNWGNSLEFIEDNSIHKYTYYDENKNFKFSIWLNTPKENTIDTFIKESKNYKKYYEENNVYDIISLLKYLSQNTKNNIFTNTRKLEWNYTMHILLSTLFENASDLMFIEGDYKGIMCTFENNNQKEIIIIKNGLSYEIQFLGLDYFTDEYVTELLKNLKIEGEI